jgi:hypothetical protein
MLGKFKSIFQRIKSKFFVDDENAQRFFAVEYGKNAEAAYNYWLAHKRLIKYY